jgi:hypothetical protein
MRSSVVRTETVMSGHSDREVLNCHGGQPRAIIYIVRIHFDDMRPIFNRRLDLKNILYTSHFLLFSISIDRPISA